MEQKMLKLTEIKRRLQFANLARVAREAGVGHKTLWDVMMGRNKNPSYATVEKLSDFLTAPVVADEINCQDIPLEVWEKLLARAAAQGGEK